MLDIRPRPLSTAERLAKYGERAPRYTSYPTAVQFTPDVDAATYRGWLAELPADAPISLYLHVPFCAQLCWYCGCNTRAVTRRRPVADYVELLLQEIRLLREALPARLPVQAVHLGGGTPNMLSPADLDRLFAALRGAFAFTPDVEIAAELDPGVLNAAWVAAAGRSGLSRASLGVQNLHPAVQKAVNRPERLEDIAACVQALRAAGVRSINFDLMYGLPHQTVANTVSTIEALLRLRPERFAVFGYAHVPWMKPHQKLIDEAALAGPDDRLAQSEAAAERLQAAGYVRIGLDHYALPTDELARARAEGRLRRNFQGYTTDSAPTLLALGASAIGSLPQGMVQNETRDLAWRTAVGDNQLSVVRGVAVTDEDRFRGEIIERLMCDLEVDLAATCARHGRKVEALAPEMARLEAFVRDGLANWRGPVLTVAPEGRQFVRSLAAVFDAHLAPEARRHAAAV
ncbi:oxygen-independent coproporphyrinogen III oxidase [Phenylobacterium sp. LjRoot219]|uniref:oxygen-independent coproporphyrinogen III oxidase n=1 Tax=Phenylobacterium sp. LjRoot219 TaxID=3342283 RepID=UPI003ECCD5AE